MTRQLQVGIIGCGSITQEVHGPTLTGLTDMFSIVACSDVRSEFAEHFATTTGAVASDDPFSLIADESVDVVLIATPDARHSDYILAACEAEKKAVLVERPLALNARIARDIAAIAGRSKTAVVISCFHLSELAVQRAERAWAGQQIVLGEFRSILDPNSQFVSDVAPSNKAAEHESQTVSVFTHGLAALEVLGPDIGIPDVMSLKSMIGLNIHDIAVMRRLLGDPNEITFAERFDYDGLHVGFRYGAGRVYLTSLTQSKSEVDLGFSLRAKNSSVNVNYPSNYGPNESSLCTFSSNANGGVERLTWRDSYNTGFRGEWKRIYDFARGKRDIATDLSSAVRDLEVCEELLARLKQ